jgi:glucokinase
MEILRPPPHILNDQPASIVWHVKAHFKEHHKAYLILAAGFGLGVAVVYPTLKNATGVVIEMLTKENVEFTLVYQSGGKILLQNHKE